MRLVLLSKLLLAVIAFTTVTCFGQTTYSQVPNQARLQAQQELNQATYSYREGRFADAEAHSEKAVGLDPQNRTALAFLARCLHAQYRPGVNTEENLAKAEQAIAAYKRILELVPNDEESYKAIAYLFGAMNDDESQRAWIFKRASDTSIDATKRADAYVALASKDWDCSFKLTEHPTTKEIEIDDRGKATVRYLLPKESKEFETAKQCATSGFSLAQLAIGLAPENESAWSFKTNLLLELAKLSQMSKDESERQRLLREYEIALAETTRLAQANQDAKERVKEERAKSKPKPF